VEAEDFSRNVEVARARLRQFQEEERVPGSEASELLHALEELQAAEAELRHQTDELAAARLELETERTRYHDLFESAPDAYLVTDSVGRIWEANRAARHLLNVEPRALLGKMLASFVAPEDRRHFRTELARLAAEREPQMLWFRMAPRDRAPVDVAVSFSSSPGRPDLAPRFRWLIRDVTEQRRAESEARTLNQDLRARELEARQAAEQSEAQSRHVQKLESIGLLAGGIAHDFNNLLHVILGNTDIALSRLAANASAREPLDEVIRATLRAGSLTKQLLAYCGKSETLVEQLDLSREVRDMATLLRTAISKQATLVWDLATGLPPVSADATQLRQIVMNLITNASEALSEDAGQIVLRTGLVREDVDYVFLEVSDSGVGMSPETLRRIFDPFFTTKVAGRGLGLAAVMGIVDAHGGRVRIRTAPGEGSTFRILLPAAEGPANTAAQVTDKQQSWRGHGTILLAEDEEGVREVATRMLARVGFTVLAATDGREALGLLGRHREQVVAVLLDLSMPRMGGREAFRRIRERWPQLPVVLMSGYAEEALPRLDQGRAGPTRFLQKPFMPDDLASALEDVLLEAERAGTPHGHA
jgi:PAS domain S-box-containing protein